MKHKKITKDKLLVVDKLLGEGIWRCDNCLKNVEKHPECDGLHSPLNTFLKDDSLAGDRARKLIKKYDGDTKLCGLCFWGIGKGRIMAKGERIKWNTE